MRSANILYKDELAGVITQQDDGSFIFKYDASWINNNANPSISLTLPKSKKEFHATHLFPFFFNMIPEGSNKQIICKTKRIDGDDYFSLLMEVGTFDTIGAVRVIKK
jgi:HipA-like protein